MGVGAKTNVGYGHLSEALPSPNQEQELPSNQRQQRGPGGGGRGGRNRQQQQESSNEEQRQSLMKKNEGLQRNDVIYGVVTEAQQDRVKFEVWIEGYDKRGNVMTEEARFMREGMIIEFKVSKVKEDGTFTFKDVKVRPEDRRNRRR